VLTIFLHSIHFENDITNLNLYIKQVVILYLLVLELILHLLFDFSAISSLCNMLRWDSFQIISHFLDYTALLYSKFKCGNWKAPLVEGWGDYRQNCIQAVPKEE
jgi:hypothetical protein